MGSFDKVFRFGRKGLNIIEGFRVQRVGWDFDRSALADFGFSGNRVFLLLDKLYLRSNGFDFGGFFNNGLFRERRRLRLNW